MAILKNVEIHFVHCDPKRPQKKFNPTNPTWECQLRTKDKAVKDEWLALNLRVKPVMDENDVVTHYRVNLKKKSLKVSGPKEKPVYEPAPPVQVINGKGADVDPNTIGNGSIANVRIFQHDYVYEGKKGIKSILMAIQLVKHIVYVPKPMEDFGEAETETIMPDPEDEEEDRATGDAPAATGAADGKVF
jgi:hypothetical protein